MVLIHPLHGFARPGIHPRPQHRPTYCKRVARCIVAIRTIRTAKPAAIGPALCVCGASAPPRAISKIMKWVPIVMQS